jgi:hypothetical protein
MSWRRKRRLIGGGNRFLILLYMIIDSPAWRDLSGNAVKLLMAIWRRHNGRNNGEISFSEREGAAILKVNQTTAGRAFDELMSHGFIVCTRQSAFTLKTRQARLWRLTTEPSGAQQEHPATRDYERWTPPSDRRRKSEHRGATASDRGTTDAVVNNCSQNGGLTEALQRQIRSYSQAHRGTSASPIDTRGDGGSGAGPTGAPASEREGRRDPDPIKEQSSTAQQPCASLARTAKTVSQPQGEQGGIAMAKDRRDKLTGELSLMDNRQRRNGFIRLRRRVLDRLPSGPLGQQCWRARVEYQDLEAALLEIGRQEMLPASPVPVFELAIKLAMKRQRQQRQAKT